MSFFDKKNNQNTLSKNKKRIEFAKFKANSIFTFNKISLIQKIIAVIFWLVVWQLLASYIDSNLIIAGPYEVLLKIKTLLVEKKFYTIVFTSTYRIIISYIISIIVAIVLALLASKYRFFETLIYPLVSILRSIPVASIIIVLFLFLPSKYISLVVSMMMVIPLIYSSMLVAIKNKDRQLEEMAKIFNVPFLIRLKDIYINNTLLILKPALENSISFAFKSAIAAEVIAAPNMTIGNALYEAKIYLNTDDLFAWTFICILLSIIFEISIKFLIARMNKLING